MSRNRPKIWLNEKTYVYRSDYNICVNLPLYYRDALMSCRKFVTECETEWGTVHKGDLITVTLRDRSYWSSELFYKVNGVVTRIDFNYHHQPDELQILDERGNLQIFHFRTDDVINWIGKKEEQD